MERPVLAPSQRTQAIAVALERARDVFTRRPAAGLHDDAAATVTWQGGLRLAASHASGLAIQTDMPTELGGSGDRVSPGWVFRAGLAACAATVIAMTAAAEGIELTQLEVTAGSRSDARGVLGMTGADGQPVSPASQDLRLAVRIAAASVPEPCLRELVERCQALAPIGAALRAGRDIALDVDIAAAQDAA